MKNKIHYSFLLSISVIGSLLLLSLMDDLSVGRLDLRNIDLLTDIRPSTPDDGLPGKLDSILVALEQEVHDSVGARRDSVVEVVTYRCPEGITCIEDYTSDGSALKHFLDALENTRRTGEKLRIAFYGDSFIEGDVFCGAFRDTIQTIFGGRGVGFVPITSNVTGFRNTIKHKFENWQTSSLVERTSDVAIGPAGFTFLPLTNNWLEFKPSRQRYLREFNTITLYYKNFDSAVLHYSIDTVRSKIALKVSDRLEEWRYEGRNIKSVFVEFDPFDSLAVYGASFEGPTGVYVDNFSIRGNSGLNLDRIDASMYRDFNRFRNYRLIILQFGLNLVASENLNYAAYVKRMVRVVNNLKRNFPECSFLLLSVSDRSVNEEGVYKTMDAIPLMRDAQRLIAIESQIGFWDMFQAMGGEGSMVKFVNSSPALGARDYTHLTFRGGRTLSGRLVKSLIHEFERYTTKPEKPGNDASIQAGNF